MTATRLLRFLTAAIAILAVAAFLAVWLGSRTPWARGYLAGRLADATGLPAEVGGLRVGLWGRIRVEAEGIALGQPPGFGPKPLAELGALRLALPWSALFGDVALESVEIADATLRPALAADGSDNWSALIERLAAAGGEGGAGWRIGRLVIERGALEFVDAAAASEWRLTAITVAAGPLAPQAEFPLDVRLAGVSGEHTFHFAFAGQVTLDTEAGRYRAQSLSFRGWAGGDPLPLAGIELIGRLSDAAYDTAAGLATASGGSFNLAGIPGEFAGTWRAGGEPPLELTVRTEAFAPRAPAVAFGTPLPATADPTAFGSLRLAATCRLEEGALVVDSFEALLDETRIEGRLVPARRQLRATADRIDLDRYLPPAQRRAKEKKATLEATLAELAALDVDAEIRIAQATVAGSTLRGVVLRVEPDVAP